MAQPIQQGTQPTQPAQVTSQPGQQPVQQPGQPPVEKKKSRWWIWVIVAVVIIGIAAGIFFWLF